MVFLSKLYTFPADGCRICPCSLFNCDGVNKTEERLDIKVAFIQWCPYSLCIGRVCPFSWLTNSFVVFLTNMFSLSIVSAPKSRGILIDHMNFYRYVTIWSRYQNCCYTKYWCSIVIERKTRCRWFHFKSFKSSMLDVCSGLMYTNTRF